MRTFLKSGLFIACTALALVSVGCSDDGSGEAGETGGTDEADGTGDTTSDGETGTSTSETGPGDTGDTGPGDTGDTGPGDTGDTTGPGDTGDTGPGDTGDTGPGDTGGSVCPDYETEDECTADPECQAVIGSPLKENGPDSPCLEAAEFIGCIPQSGCGDAPTWFCVGGNAKPVLVPDTCGPADAEMCDGPADPVEACP